MKRWLALAALLALAPQQRAQALFCSNCTQEGGEIIREVKRALEFAKLLAEAKRSAEADIRTWQAVGQVRDFRSMTNALGRLSNSYYPEGRDAVQALRDGQSLFGGGLSLDRLLSRGTVARLEHNYGNAERWYDAMEERQRVVAFGREAAQASIRNSQRSLSALSAAEAQLAAKQGQAEIAAAQGALQLASLNAQHNRTQLEAVRLQIEAEALNLAARAEERKRQADLDHAASYASAFDRLREVRAR